MAISSRSSSVLAMLAAGHEAAQGAEGDHGPGSRRTQARVETVASVVGSANLRCWP
ncbi:hypothetical protein ACFQYP_41960 [Nonomuraea antimicrobica]